MKLIVDTESRTLCVDGRSVELYSNESFELLSDLWLKIGWNQKYVYSFSWLGFPIIQLPEDILRYQEAIAALKPDVIVETGVAHGGSAIFAASLCKMMGKGRIIAIDVDIRDHNRKRLEAHPLIERITLIEGSSTDTAVVDQVKSLIRPGETVLVVLDSNHTHAHVMRVLELYAPLVTPGSYIVATDGSMAMLADVPRGRPDWASDNPMRAAHDFAARNTGFAIEQPAWPFNESTLSKNITHWPGA